MITFFNGTGDCEDYAVAKYVPLREAGEAVSNLRIVIIRDQLIEEDHAVTAMRLDGRWLILDNRRMAIVEDTNARNYRPLFFFNEAGIWKYYVDAFRGKASGMGHLCKIAGKRCEPLARPAS